MLMQRGREEVVLLIGSERNFLFDLDEKRRRRKNVSLDMSRDRR
jgi:hypothetical protein